MFIGMTGEGEVVEVFEPPKPIKNTVYFCDKCFHTESIEKLFVQQELCGLVFVDGENCELFTVDVSNCNRDKSGKASTRLKQHKKGGQSSARFGRLHDEKVVRYLKEISEEAREAFADVNTIVIAGISKRPAELIKYLHTDVANKVIGVLVMTNATNFADVIIPQMDALINTYKSDKETKQLAEFVAALNDDHGKAVYGTAEIDESLQSGELKKLFVSRDCQHPQLIGDSTELIEIGVSLKAQELISMYGERFGLKWY